MLRVLGIDSTNFAQLLELFLAILTTYNVVIRICLLVLSFSGFNPTLCIVIPFL